MASIAAVTAAVSIAATVASTAVAVVGQIQSSNQKQAYMRSQAQQAEYTARTQREQAEYIAKTQRQRADYEQQRAEQMRTAGEVAKLQKEQEGQRLISKQMSLYGASGLEPTMGSPLAVMEETAAQVERDALMERYKYQLGASGAEMEAGSLRSSATLQEIQGKTQSALYEHQSKMYSSYSSAIGSSTPWKVGSTLITGLSPLLKQETWAPFKR